MRTMDVTWNQNVVNFLTKNNTDLVMSAIPQSNGVEVMRTKAISTLQSEHIYSYAKSGEWPVFTYFSSFDLYVWVFTIISVISISLTDSIIERGLQRVLNNVWRFSSLLLSEPLPRNTYLSSKQSLSKRILILVWLIASTILLAGFSGVLRGFFMSKLPLEVIDSFEDLHKQKSVKVISKKGFSFESLVRNPKSTNEILKEIGERTIFIDQIPLEIENHRITRDLINKLKSGKFVLILSKTYFNCFLNFEITEWTKMLNKLLYVSKYGFDDEYYSLLISNGILSLENDLNNL
jgi:hypothetical protein